MKSFIYYESSLSSTCYHYSFYLGRKAMINLDNIFKSRDITLPTKVHLVRAMVFPVVMYGCESWTIKKAEHWRTDAFELWCWWRLLRVPWSARRSNQFILKEISPNQPKQKKASHTHMFIQTFLLSICCMPHTEDIGVNKTKFPALGS